MKSNPAVSILKKSWLRLKKKDSLDWSLRSLAKEAGISPGYLSKIFSGQKPLRARHAKKLIEILRLDDINREIVLTYYETPQKNISSKFLMPKNMDSFELPNEKSEWLLEKWYRLPILDLMTTSNFENNPKFIAKRLGLTVSIVEDSINKLVEENLAYKDNEGILKKVHKKIRFPTTISKRSIRNYHKSQLERGIFELDTKVAPKDFKNRLIVGLSIASNPQKLDEAKNILHMALYKAAEILSDGECTEVYQMNLQFFPVTCN